MAHILQIEQLFLFSFAKLKHKNERNKMRAKHK